MKQYHEYLNSIANILEPLHKKWSPHQTQALVGKYLLRDDIDSVFVQCGRKFGKTELAIYLLWRFAMQYPGSPLYYVAPFQTQAKEILWADPRIKYFGPKEWLKPGSAGTNNAEMRLNFVNDSFIKVTGSDNFESLRGVRFKLTVYDEYKDHRPEFRLAMRPNAAVLKGKELFLGTPPDHDCDYVKLAEEHRENKSGNMFWIQASTSSNPHIPKDWLEREKNALYGRGEGDVWEREYEARYVKGGASKVFPMYGSHLISARSKMVAESRRDAKKLQWAVVADPAAATVFGVLFAAYNPFTKKLRIFDEIYEKQQSEMTVKKIGQRMIEMREELWDREWDMLYDEAATWFANEYHDHFPDDGAFTPSQKSANDKEYGITLIREMMLRGQIEISDSCKWLGWELDNYMKDKNGKIPKKNDHLIDGLRYLLAFFGYSLDQENEPEAEDPDLIYPEKLDLNYFHDDRIKDDWYD